MPPNFDLEQPSPHLVCGIDEVGRGPLAGPVVAAAVIFKPGIDMHSHDILTMINDSKKLSAKKRAYICESLPDICDSAIGTASVADIDEHNIFQATFIAMKRAYDKLTTNISISPKMALIDGKFTPSLPCHTLPVIKGDQKSMSIAAASIIAKEYRDGLMAELADTHPYYGWEKNAGYGTKQHLQALQQYGVTPHHRKSFKPIHQLITTNN